ncbi:MAG TPA: hypothetical protein VGC13_21160 [Longimicrobium sp.]|jgi:hypothetical protein|uniref:hypothetical protein n=1 Tax=Longimicrobium sp. TaxID=2029185 RepID=UPI002EDB39AA
MVDEQGDFDPIALRGRLAERNEHFAEFLDHPLHGDEVAASSPGWTEWYAYRALPADAQDPPGLTSADFARAYRDIPHPAGILDRKRGE